MHRVLERCRFLTLDGPSFRTRHIDPSTLPQPAIISGIGRPEYLEPTPEPDNVGIATVTRKGGKTVTIPLNYKACRALASYLKARPAVEYETLFLNKYRWPLSKRGVQRLVAKYLAEAGIQGASVHTLRHTMATHHVAAGTDLKTLQETMGHADLATTAMYVQLAKTAQRKALQEHAL